jgi:hypothetical protein
VIRRDRRFVVAFAAKNNADAVARKTTKIAKTLVRKTALLCGQNRDERSCATADCKWSIARRTALNPGVMS